MPSGYHPTEIPQAGFGMFPIETLRLGGQSIICFSLPSAGKAIGCHRSRGQLRGEAYGRIPVFSNKMDS